MKGSHHEWLLIGMMLVMGIFVSSAAAQVPLHPEVKHLDQIKEFPINIPGIRGASLLKTSTADMILTHGDP